MRFNFFGINIFPVAQYDHFFLAPRQEEVAVGIEISQIAGQKPSVAHHGCRGVWPIPVTLHHNCATQRYLADRRPILLGLWIYDFCLDSLHYLPDRPDYIVMG